MRDALYAITPLWRWAFNPARTLRQLADGPLDARARRDVSALRAEGIVVRAAVDVFDEPAVLDEVTQVVNETMLANGVEAAVARGEGGKPTKAFLFDLSPKKLETASPFLRLALQPRLLRTVNAYLGMWSYLRAVAVWLNVPTPEPAKETQLWHWDSDDHRQVKVFVYLSDVTTDSGPFCFAPRTHAAGVVRRRLPSLRATDEQMAALIPSDRWRICTGAPGTVILADTTGYHRGLKPRTAPRLLVMFQYTSGTCPHPRSFELAARAGVALDPRQAYALRN